MHHHRLALTAAASLFAIGLMSAPADAARKELTPSELYQGCKVPEKRDFPIDESISACEDFHKHVCNKAESSFELPSDRPRWIFAFGDSGERILQAKKNFFKRMATDYQPKFARTKNVQSLYKSCMNIEASKIGETEFVRETWGQIKAASDKTRLLKLINSRLLTPDFAMVEVFHITNQSNPDYNDIAIMADGMTLPEKSYYQEAPAVEDLRQLATTLFTELKLDQPAERANAVVDFEMGLAKVYPSRAELRQLISADTYMKPADWQAAYPNFKFNKIFSKVPAHIAFRNITKDGMAYINDYVGGADTFKLQSVLAFNSLKGMMDDAYPNYFKVYFEFLRKHHGGPKERPPRDERCTKLAMGSLGMEIDAELLDILFPKFDQDKVRDVAESVRQAIISGIEQNSWLSDGARKEALNKIKSAPLKLVRPSREQDWNFLNLKKLNDTEPIANLMKIEEAKIARMLTKVRNKRNRGEWGMSPLTVNAYYSSGNNEFVLPQAILQYPFFSASQSKIENLAAMGMVIGHELGHGIDDEGSKYDASGRLHKWMTEADLKNFQMRGSKLIDQFNKIGHDGKLTLGENIGDNVGLAFALATAFPKKDEADLGEVRKFFVSYGRLWCGVQTPESEKMQLKTDPHALGRERINQQVMHKDLFHKAFNCKAGDKMFLRPEDRVQVW